MTVKILDVSIPIVLDAATFPIQAFIWFGFLYKGPCGGGLLTD